jgi:hypothetical protein
MATLTIPLADQYTIGGEEYFQFAHNNGEGQHRLLRRDYRREVHSNTVAMLKPLARHVQVETGAILPKALSKMRKHELVAFCAENIVFEQPPPPPQPVRHLYTITLNLSYHQNPEPEQERWDTPEKYAEHLRLFHEMEAYLDTHTIEEHVKENDPKEYVENLTDYGSDVIAAEWLDGFRISFTVDSPLTPDQLRHDLQTNSLEDGEYESGYDNGWSIKTLTGSWEIGLVDYRRNLIEIEEVIA